MTSIVAFNSAVHLLVMLGIGGVGWTIAFLAYHVLWHPLAKYPGPFFAKFTNLYAAYHAYIGDIHTDIRKCHDIWGCNVRYAPNRLLFDDAQAANDIYGLKSPMTKSKVYDVLVHKAANTLTLRNKAEHLRRRRIMGQGFSNNALRDFEIDIKDAVGVLCDQIKLAIPQTCGGNNCAWSAAKDMSRYFDCLTFDIMSKVIFSDLPDTLRQEKWRHVAEAIGDSNVRIGTLLQGPELATWKLDKRLFPQAIQGRNRFVRFIGKTMQGRMSMKPDQSKTDIFAYFQHAVDPVTGAKLSMSELTAEAATLIVAGSDTSSTAMAASLFYVLRNAQIYSRATEEVRAAFASLQEISSGPVQTKCKYLRACIDEALRLAPPAGGPLWREVPAEGAQITGIAVPGGIDVGVGIFSIHHNASQFPDPYRFQPERWCSPAGSSGGGRSAYMPFSLGQRGCIGKSLALNEVSATIATLLWEFDMELCVDAPTSFVLKDHVTGAKDPLPVRFRHRKMKWNEGKGME